MTEFGHQLTSALIAPFYSNHLHKQQPPYQQLKDQCDDFSDQKYETNITELCMLQDGTPGEPSLDPPGL